MANSAPVVTLYDRPMWQSLERQSMQLQKCDACGTFRYPPGPVCADCLSLAYTWTDISGQGKIASWVVFHKQYFADHVPPYNAIAVRLDEGPILVSNLIGPEPKESWIGKRVVIAYRQIEGRTQHAFKIAP
ncbi:MAG: OB-fold domain-containing protein [Proteobacteria bacterium]|nr:OB-fold domain-containing protein [Pseudomonadota bacterium]